MEAAELRVELEQMHQLLQETEQLRLLHHHRHEEWLQHRIGMRLVCGHFDPSIADGHCSTSLNAKANNAHASQPC